MNKKHMKNTMGLATFGIVGATGMSVMNNMGASTVGVAKVVSAAKPIGGMMGAGMVMDSLGHLKNSAQGINKKKKF